MAFAPFIPKAVRRLSLLGLITLSIYYVRFGLDAHQGGWARIGLIVAGTLEALCFIREVYDQYTKAWPLTRATKERPARMRDESKNDYVGTKERLLWVCDEFRRMWYDYRHQRYYIPFCREKPIIIHSRDQMEELSHAPELSQPAVYADIFGFKYTLKDEDTNRDPLDTAAARFRLFSRTIKVIGQSELHLLQPYLHAKIVEVVERKIADGDLRDDGWRSINSTSTMKDTASEPLALYIFGKTLSENPKFRAALWRYYQDTISYGGALQFFPRCLEGYLFSKITKDGQALKDLIAMLKPIVADPGGNWEEDESLKKITLMYHMIDSSQESSYWTPNIIIQALIGIWFAAAHQPWVNLDFAFLELCQRPDVVALLLAEIASTPTLDVPTIMNGMPVLDSFLKESMRWNPMDDLAIRRKSLRPYTFHNPPSPLSIPPNRTVAISSHAQMHSPSFYPSPYTFLPLRYTQPAIHGLANPMHGTRLTDAAREFPVWGFGGHVCPGRHHASLTLKTALLHLVRKYECKLEDGEKGWIWRWDNFALPVQGARVLLREREEGGGG